MGEFTDKVAAAGNKIAGGTKEVIGDAIDSEQMEAEGQAQQDKASAQHAAGTVKGAMGNDI